MGALLLFVTNVGAILVTGVLVMTLYRVRTAALESAVRPPLGRRAAITVIVAFVVVIAVPLALLLLRARRVTALALERLLGRALATLALRLLLPGRDFAPVAL